MRTSATKMLAILALSCLLGWTAQGATKSDHGQYNEAQVFGGLKTHRPGLKLRMTQATTEMVRDYLLQYGVAYLNWDLKWESSGVREFGFWPMRTDFYYENFEWEPFKIDVSKFSCNFTHMLIDDKPVVYLVLPAVEHWAFGLDYYYKTLRSHGGHFDLEFRDLEALATVELKATKYGQLYPHLHDFDIRIEDSELYTHGAFKQFKYRQIFDLGKYILQNAYNLFGARMINRNLFAATQTFLNDQIHPFKVKLPQLGKDGTFNLNWRLTDDPHIHDGVIDFAFLFDIGPETSACLQVPDKHDYYFQNEMKTKYLQMVMSDRVPNCMLEAFARQDFFKRTFNSQFLREHLGTHNVKVNAALLARAYPVLAEIYGADQELDIELEVKHPMVHFGLSESDMELDFSLHFGVKLAGNMNYILYDELDFHGEMDIQIDQEVLIGSLNSVEWTKAKFSNPDRTTPVYNDVGITGGQYAEFWDFLETQALRWQTFLNDEVLLKGVPLPYWNLEFITKFTFHPHAMIMVADVFYSNVTDDL